MDAQRTAQSDPTLAPSQQGTNPLEPTGEDFTRWVGEFTPRLVEFLDGLVDAPAQAAELAEAPSAKLPKALPRVGLPLSQILDLLFEEVLPKAFETAGPGYLAYVPGGGLPSAALAELVASISNRYVGVSAAAPFATDIETQVIRWLCELMGFDQHAFGLLTTGGSMSNFIAVVCAREKMLGPDLSRACAYVSSEVHHCMTKALRLAGLPASGIRGVPVCADFTMDLSALKALLAKDQSEGLQPFLVCGSAGTVNTGAVDDLDAIAEICEAHELWFHIDGAYGGAFQMVPETRTALRGLHRCDSIALDPHKGLFLAYGTGALILREPKILREAHAVDAAYLPPFSGGFDRPDFAELSPELSRDWRGLRLWLPFLLHGTDVFQATLREKYNLAQSAAQAIESLPDVRLAHAPPLSLFAFRHEPKSLPAEQWEDHNRGLLERINKSKRIMLTGTEVDGLYYVRVCVLHLRTHEERMNEAVEIMRSCILDSVV